MKSQKMIPLTTEYLDKKFGAMDARFDSMDKNFSTIDIRLSSVENGLKSVNKHLLEIDERLDSHENHFIEIDKHLVSIDECLDRHEERFDRLEKHIDFKFAFFKEDVVRSLEPMFADMRIDLLGYKDSMVSRTMNVEVEQSAMVSVAKRTRDILDNHEDRIKKLEVSR